MGVRRSETRLLLGYLEARLQLTTNSQKGIETKALRGGQEDIELHVLDGRELELRKLIEMLGGYND